MVKGLRPAWSLVAVFGVACLGACALIVGDPHGHLLAPVDASDNDHDAAGLPRVDAPTGCSSGDCDASAVMLSCAKGGCNTADGACTGSAPGCFCDDDSQCTTGKCVPTQGENEKSCGASCTGTGAADGFGCQLAACTVTAFGYAPSNFTPSKYTVPQAATTDCNGTYSSSAHEFINGGCKGQVPAVAQNVAQTSGGQAVDILIFKSLAIASTSTLTLVGASPVILAVYGDATIRGTIDASANGATPGAGGDGCPAASNGPDAGTGSWEPGGGGAGQAAAGGVGGTSRGVPGEPAGGIHGTGTVPLSGGCLGGLPFVGLLGFAPTAGAGAGGVELSVAGVLDLAGGTVKANGGNGGNGETGKCTNDYPAQNGTGGAGGGSGGCVLLEGSTIVPGTTTAQGGTGGAGGTAASPNSQDGGGGGPGGAAGSAGAAGGAGVQHGSAPPQCSWGGYWSGGGGGGGGGGYVSSNAGGGACPCTTDAECSTGLCSNASNQCAAGSCSGSTAAGTYDSIDCQILTPSDSVRVLSDM